MNHINCQGGDLTQPIRVLATGTGQVLALIVLESGQLLKIELDPLQAEKFANQLLRGAEAGRLMLGRN